MKKIKLKFGDLFSGAGGLSLGLEHSKYQGTYEGFKSIWALDDHKDSCETYKKNISPNNEVKIYCKDVRAFNLESLEGIDMLTFGFPCNDFSLVGEKLGFKGIYGPLYSYGVKILKLLSPSCFIAENVTGLASANSGKAFKKIQNDLINAGYDIWVNEYKLEQYGVPQARHRIIIIGFRKDLRINYIQPEPTNDLVTASQALDGIPINAPNNERTKQSEKVIERLSYIEPGKNAWSENIPDHLKLNVKGAKLSNIYRKLEPNKPSYTVTGSGGGGTHMYHWEENRALTNRERARLQSFPDSFIFQGSKESVRRQIGMAIPPKFSEILGESILKALSEK